jgi:hypothetical protein
MRLPSPSFLPAGHYYDLQSAARMLMPAKVTAQQTVDDEPQCTLVNDGAVGMLEVAAVQGNDLPMWAQETDSSHLDTLARMLVRSKLVPMQKFSFVTYTRMAESLVVVQKA